MTAGLDKPQKETNNVISSVSCKISIRQTGSSRLNRGEVRVGRWLVLMMLILTLLSQLSQLITQPRQHWAADHLKTSHFSSINEIAIRVRFYLWRVGTST